MGERRQYTWHTWISLLAVTGLVGVVVFSNLVVHIAGHQRITRSVARCEPWGFLAEPRPPDAISHIVPIDHTADRIENRVWDFVSTVDILRLPSLLRENCLSCLWNASTAGNHAWNLKTSLRFSKVTGGLSSRAQVFVLHNRGTMKHQLCWRMPEIHKSEIDFSRGAFVYTENKIHLYRAGLSYPRSVVAHQSIMRCLSGIFHFYQLVGAQGGVRNDRDQSGESKRKLNPLHWFILFAIEYGASLYGLGKAKFDDRWWGVFLFVAGLGSFAYSFRVFVQALLDVV
jgi:hypothetical protein